MTRRFHFDLDELALRNVMLALEQRMDFCEGWLSDYGASADPERVRLRGEFLAELRDGQALLALWGRMLASSPPPARAGQLGRAH